MENTCPMGEVGYISPYVAVVRELVAHNNASKKDGNVSVSILKTNKAAIKIYASVKAPTVNNESCCFLMVRINNSKLLECRKRRNVRKIRSDLTIRNNRKTLKVWSK